MSPGKHAWNPKLTEDQPEPQQRLSKRAMKKNNPMGEDYIAGNSPFITKVGTKEHLLGPNDLFISEGRKPLLKSRNIEHINGILL